MKHKTLELTRQQHARIELIRYLWTKLREYTIKDMPNARLSTDPGKELEERLVNWIFQARKNLEPSLLCLRLADNPILGSSGSKHKVDCVVYYSDGDVHCGYLVECKNTDVRSLKRGVHDGRIPLIQSDVVSLFLMKAYDICPVLFFRRHAYVNTPYNFCVILTTRPLTESALSRCLSFGVCVIQPSRVTYRNLLQELGSNPSISQDLVEQIPVYYPPEVSWAMLRAYRNSSKSNIRLSYDICKRQFRKHIHNQVACLEKCEYYFDGMIRENKDLVDKTEYLSYYLNSLIEEGRLSEDEI